MLITQLGVGSCELRVVSLAFGVGGRVESPKSKVQILELSIVRSEFEEPTKVQYYEIPIFKIPMTND